MPFDRSLVEAKLSLDLVASADLPKLAVEALEAGLDGATICRLAALDHPTYFEVRDLLPRAMEEMGLRQVPKGEASRRLARQLAREILTSNDDPLQHLRDFESLWIRAGHSKEIESVATLYDDVWIAESSGQSDKEIRTWVIARLQAFAQSQDASTFK